ncbi:MAG: FHA domain-containing protein [bacterium]|nr:FHA domain-containing protein [bacterium]
MSQSSGEHPILIIQGEKVTEPQKTLTQDSVIIGRGEDCDIVIPERAISRQHIRIFKDNEDWFIQDMDSRNGTWLNGHKLLGEQRLYDGDEINLGQAINMQFLGTGATAPNLFDAPDFIGTSRAAQPSGRLRLDSDARRVFIGESEIEPPLSPPQYRLLELLYNNVGRICTREQVIEAVWPDVVGEGVSEQAIDALVRRLRDRITEVDPDWQYIVTVRGHGFRLVQS